MGYNNSKLEKEFEELMRTVGATISQKLKLARDTMTKLTDVNSHPIAAQALNEATKLSDEHGIPFRIELVAVSDSHVMRLDNNYVPDTYFEKFQNLDPAVVSALTEVETFSLMKNKSSLDEDDWDESPENDDDDGWRPSSRNC